MLTRSRRLAVVGAAAAACLAAGGVVATSSGAAPADEPLPATYDVKGHTFITTPQLTVPLAKSTLTAGVTADKVSLKFAADLPLPPSTVSFKIAGTVPATATVVFTQLGKVTGRIKYRPGPGTFAVNSKAMYEVSLRDVVVNGQPANVGDSCQTVDPVTVYAGTPNGKAFDLFQGGVLTSRYPLGDFQNCGDTTTLINRVVPGKNNFISLTLSNAKIG